MSNWLPNGATRIVFILIGACIILGASFAFFYFFPAGKINFQTAAALDAASSTPKVPEVTHVPTPQSVKAVYFSSWAAGSKKFRDHMFDLVDNTEINSVVIDVKDYTGKIAFEVSDPELAKFDAVENRIPDIKDLIRKLHEKNVYVIARISSFQDSHLVKAHPEWAVKSASTGGVWKDFKGVKWLEAGAEPVWDYLVKIGNEAYSVGFDEINYDYIRYPSDGNMKDIVYEWGKGRSREEVMRAFFMYLREQFASTSIPLSADLFGLTTSAMDDLGIGQNLGDAISYFDFVAPMVYPSHYAKGFNGIPKPAEKPYEVVKLAMDNAVQKAIAASTSPLKIRPWLQAFDLGAIYSPAMVRAQIKATYDAGLDSWMLWDAANIYDKNDLLPKISSSTSKISTTTTRR